ncbi:uncharacterized protein LY89DRAFT_686509 [Mollisia scopiformis]|uniref:Uncharacterized protein n=1 Tax=Mollisia scopiformis TaxID=149040 RepID=A0A194X522_MOLSC|nr:uncharacterized protein LY89DRAFT_686509 [Mollisia scopiformis]KUJ14902.1 hypothetical protein LY89DRAFT_686509 [Mollisia scopiformis]
MRHRQVSPHFSLMPPIAFADVFITLGLYLQSGREIILVQMRRNSPFTDVFLTFRSCFRGFSLMSTCIAEHNFLTTAYIYS